MAIALYSPEDVVVLLAGFINISGFASGKFISVSKDVGIFSTRESSDGVVSRNHAKSGVYTVNLTLASTSESNQALSIAASLDNATKMGMFPFIIKDTLGSTLFFSPKSWIENMPDTPFDVDVTERQWNIKCANAVLMVGGNESPSSMISDLLAVGGGMVGNML